MDNQVYREILKKRDIKNKLIVYYFGAILKNHILFIRKIKGDDFVETNTTADLDMIYLLHKRFAKDKINDDSDDPKYKMYIGELK